MQSANFSSGGLLTFMTEDVMAKGTMEVRLTFDTVAFTQSAQKRLDRELRAIVEAVPINRSRWLEEAETIEPMPMETYKPIYGPPAEERYLTTADTYAGSDQVEAFRYSLIRPLGSRSLCWCATHTNPCPRCSQKTGFASWAFGNLWREYRSAAERNDRSVLDVAYDRHEPDVWFVTARDLRETRTIGTDKVDWDEHD